MLMIGRRNHGRDAAHKKERDDRNETPIAVESAAENAEVYGLPKCC